MRRTPAAARRAPSASVSVGARIDAAHKEYTTLSGTRTNALERPLRKIDEMKTRDIQLELVDDADDGNPPLALEA